MKYRYLKVFILLLNLCLLEKVHLKAQSITDLDNKRGFKDFKLGDNYYQWSASIQLIKVDETKKQYLYNGNCCNTLFDYSVEKIDLIFENNVLTIILVKLKHGINHQEIILQI